MWLKCSALLLAHGDFPGGFSFSEFPSIPGALDGVVLNVSCGPEEEGSEFGVGRTESQCCVAPGWLCVTLALSFLGVLFPV